MGAKDRRFEKQCIFLSVLSSTGSVGTAADNAGVSRWTPYRWRQTDPAFAKAWAEAARVGPQDLRNEAMRRALHGVETPVFYRGQQVATRPRYSDGLLLWLLKQAERAAERQGQERARPEPRQRPRDDVKIIYECGTEVPFLEHFAFNGIQLLREAERDAAAGDANAYAFLVREAEREVARGKHERLDGLAMAKGRGGDRAA